MSEKKDLEMVYSAISTANASGHNIVFVVIDSIRGMHRGSLNDDVVGEVMQAVNADL